MHPKKVKYGKLRIRHIYYLFLIAASMTSCIAPRTFYHEGYEPVLLPKQARAQVNVSYRLPLRLAVAGSYAPTQRIALRATGGYGLSYASAGISSLYFFGKDNTSFFLGPDLIYQQRQRLKNSQVPFVDIRKYNINCRYLSGGLIAGIHHSVGKSQHQFVVKVNYNKVINYDYIFRHGENSGKDIALTFDEEEIHSSIPDFFSGEFNYCYLRPMRERVFFKFQLGMQYTQKSFVQNYEFDTEQEIQGFQAKNSTRLHPLGNPFSASFGFIFYLPR